VCNSMHKNWNQATTLKFMIRVYHSCSTAWTSIDIGRLTLLTCDLHSSLEAQYGKGVTQEGSDVQQLVSSFMCNMLCLGQKAGVIWSFCNCSTIN